MVYDRVQLDHGGGRMSTPLGLGAIRTMLSRRRLADLAERLFLPAPEFRAPGLRQYLFAGAAVVVGTLLSLGRTPGYGALNTLWLEDGTVFLQDAAGKSSIAAITTPYSGYFHLLPRLMAEVAVMFP